MSEAVIGAALLRVGKNAVGFRGFAELFFRGLFFLGIAVRMPLQRGLAIGGLDFLRSRRAADAENFVVVALAAARAWDILRLSVNPKMLRRRLVSAGAFGSHSHAHQARTQHAAVEQIAFLHDLQDRTVGMLVRFHALDGLVIVRIERLAFGGDALQAVPG